MLNFDADVKKRKKRSRVTNVKTADVLHVAATKSKKRFPKPFDKEDGRVADERGSGDGATGGFGGGADALQKHSPGMRAHADEHNTSQGTAVSPSKTRTVLNKLGRNNVPLTNDPNRRVSKMNGFKS